MQITKIKSYIGFATRMGKTIYGLECIRRSKRVPHVIIYDESLGSCALRSITAYCVNNEIPLVKVPYLLCEATKREKTKLIGILDESLGLAIIKSSEVTEVEHEQ